MLVAISAKIRRVWGGGSSVLAVCALACGTSSGSGSSETGGTGNMDDSGMISSGASSGTGGGVTGGGGGTPGRGGTPMNTGGAHSQDGGSAGMNSQDGGSAGMHSQSGGNAGMNSQSGGNAGMQPLNGGSAGMHSQGGTCSAASGHTSESCSAPGVMFDEACARTCGAPAFLYTCSDGPPPLNDCIEQGSTAGGTLTFCCKDAACVHIATLDGSCSSGGRAVSCHPSATVDTRCAPIVDWPGSYCCPP